MTGERRVAILAIVGVTCAACEALIGITDREVSNAPSGEAGAGDAPGTPTNETGPGDETSSAPPVDTGAEGNATPEAGDDAGAQADADGATTPPPTDAGGAGDVEKARDAGDGGDGATSSIPDPDYDCALQLPNLFCDDFDSVSTVGQGWAYTYASPDAGSVQLDSMTYVSAPVSAQVVVTPQSGAVVEVQLGTTLGPVAGGVQLAFDLRVDVPTYTSFPQVAVAQLYLQKGASTQSQVNFTVGPGATSQVQMYLADGGSMSLNPEPPNLRVWTRIALVCATDGTVSLYENGVFVTSANVGAGTAGTIGLIMGAAFVNAYGTETATMEFDNIVVLAQ
jgi:hypothetical protein